jgi:universal stress protein E
VPLSTILVIIDPTTDIQPAFERGLDSARDTGAALCLYSCISAEGGYSSVESGHDTLQPLLDSLALRAKHDGVKVTTEIDWDSNWVSRAVAAAARCSASMIFKNSTDHSSVDREIRPTTDWTLLRTAPCPVLMVKNFHDWDSKKVLACINPESTEETHIKLNNQIISFARQMAESYGSDAHFVAAFHDLNHPPEIIKIAQQCGAEPAHIHSQKGKAAEVIKNVAEEINADLIIVGTVARDGIKGRVIGNTCERLLDQTHSDVLVLN